MKAMKARNIIPLTICIGVVVLDVLQPGYRKFVNIAAILKPIQVAGDQSLDAAFPVNNRAKNCKSATPSSNYIGFNSEQWVKFKQKGTGQKIEDVIQVLGQPFCVTATGQLQFFPQFSPNKKLLIETEKGKVKNAKLI